MALTPAPVALWQIELRASPAALPRLWSQLSEEERDRADRFVFPHHRERFIVAHAALRQILGETLGQPPATIEFRKGSHDKPYLTTGSLHFNLSHSADQAVVACSTEAEVGVDIEQIRDRMELDSMARQVFSPSERAKLMALRGDVKRDAFFRTWSRKEAFIKALGLGLARELGSFDVPLDPAVPARLTATRPDPSEASRWRMWDLPAPPGFMAAVVLGNADGRAQWTAPAAPRDFVPAVVTAS